MEESPLISTCNYEPDSVEADTNRIGELYQRHFTYLAFFNIARYITLSAIISTCLSGLRIILSGNHRYPSTKNTKANYLCLLLVVTFVFALAYQLPGKTKLNYIENAAQIVKGTDWSKMETMAMEMRGFSFNPDTLRFKKDAPYKLEIKNVGTEKHYFTATSFFKAVASRKIQSNTDGEIKAPYFTALEVFPGRQLDFYFVPVKKGSYYLLCTIEGHEEQGMHGESVIE